MDSKRNIRRLREMSKFEINVTVFRGEFRATAIENDTKQVRVHEQIMSKGKQVSSHSLVPGDIIQIPENEVMPCDLILLNGF